MLLGPCAKFIVDFGYDITILKHRRIGGDRGRGAGQNLPGLKVQTGGLNGVVGRLFYATRSHGFYIV